MAQGQWLCLFRLNIKIKLHQWTIYLLMLDTLPRGSNLNQLVRSSEILVAQILGLGGHGL